MILTLMKVGLIGLARDRVALTMTFVLPVAFFTVFALVFGGQGRSTTGRVRAAVVVEDSSATARRLVRALEAEGALALRTRTRAAGAVDDTATVAIDRARAEAMVRAGDVPLAIVFPAGVDTSVGRFDGVGTPILLLTDPSDPVAPQLVTGLLQQAAMSALPDVMLDRGAGMLDRVAGGLTPEQRAAVDGMSAWLRAGAESAADGPAAGGAGGHGDAAGPGGGAMAALAPVEVVEVLGRPRDTRLISFYAAGIAVMFLLFSAAAGAGTLLDEVESGTLERVLSSRAGMTGLLAAKWLTIALMGVVQIVVMFLYAAVAFGLDLGSHLPGFVVMTLATAAAAAAFGMVLATLARSRAQLGGMSTLVILLMSALGGSMFPRFLMSDAMQQAGLFTFNAWALDGYIKVFWREAPLPELAPQVGVLLAFVVAFLAVSRLLARRWERA